MNQKNDILKVITSIIWKCALKKKINVAFSEVPATEKKMLFYTWICSQRKWSLKVRRNFSRRRQIAQGLLEWTGASQKNKGLILIITGNVRKIFFEIKNSYTNSILNWEFQKKMITLSMKRGRFHFEILKKNCHSFLRNLIEYFPWEKSYLSKYLIMQTHDVFLWSISR